MAGPPTDVTVRRAAADDFLSALRVLEGALLEMDASTLRDRIDDGDVLIARDGRRLVGAAVLDGEHVEAIAVRPSRRGRGVGSALLEDALDERGRLTAEFRSGVRPFYESLGFRIESRGDRLWGVRER